MRCTYPRAAESLTATEPERSCDHFRISFSAAKALAVAHGRLSPEEAWRAAHADEEVQEQLWGSDAEALARRATRFRDFEAAARAYALLEG